MVSPSEAPRLLVEASYLESRSMRLVTSLKAWTKSSTSFSMFALSIETLTVTGLALVGAGFNRQAAGEAAEVVGRCW